MPIPKYSYRYLPLDAPIIQLHNIGPYLNQRLEKYGILTGRDLLEYFDEFITQTIQDDITISEAKSELTQWLSEVTQNARPLQCDSRNKKVRSNRRYSYQIRHSNKNGFNELVHFLRYYTKPNTFERKIIPSLKTPRDNAFPTGCRSRN